MATFDRSNPHSRIPYSRPKIAESGAFEQLVLGCTHTPDVQACNPSCTTSGPGTMCTNMRSPNS